jgi:hypothetical protein
VIRLTTDAGLAAKLARHRRALARQYADAIEALLPDPCTHRDRPSCPKCAERRTVRAAVELVHKTGGVPS